MLSFLQNLFVRRKFVEILRWNSMLWACLHALCQWKNCMVYAKFEYWAKLSHWLLCYCVRLIFSITKQEFGFKPSERISKDSCAGILAHFLSSILWMYYSIQDWLKKEDGLLKIWWMFCQNLHLVFPLTAWFWRTHCKIEGCWKDQINFNTCFYIWASWIIKKSNSNFEKIEAR